MARADAIAPAPIISQRNLDVCLLAVCSCALTLLCHQAANLSHSGPTSQPSPTVAQVEVSLKAGWFAATHQSEDEQFLDEQ
jgi:hypothetical protein